MRIREKTIAAELAGVIEVAFEHAGGTVERVLDTARKTLGTPSVAPRALA